MIVYKQKSIYIVFAAALLLGACGPAPKKKSASAPVRAAPAPPPAPRKNGPEPDLETEKAYRLNGADSLGRSCSTGLREFPDRERLCLGLQERELNNGCALEARRRRFTRDCAPERAWNESVQCRLALLQPGTSVSEKGDYPLAALLRESVVCAGREPDGRILPGLRVAAEELAEDLFVDWDPVFVAAGDPSRERSRIGLAFYRRGARGERAPVARLPVYQGSEAGLRVLSGDTEPSGRRWVLRCENRPSCR